MIHENSVMRSMSRRSRQPAFTMVELLVVIAVLGVLLAILLPTLSRARESARRSVCGSHLKSVGQGAAIYAAAWNNQLPLVGGNTNAIYWFWDITLGTGDLLVDATATATNGKPESVRRLLYCPSNPVQNANDLWEFPNQDNPVIRVIGYGWLGTRVGKAPLGTIPPDIRKFPPLRFQSRWNTGPNTSITELAFDAILSQGGQFVDINGGSPIHHTTSHLRGAKPAGGNVLCCDGHVDWKPWTGPERATGLPTAANSGEVTFWVINP
jgi:prepilin-type N-terminal cleavage/methylation domain-containing protein